MSVNKAKSKRNQYQRINAREKAIFELESLGNPEIISLEDTGVYIPKTESLFPAQECYMQGMRSDNYSF